MSARGEVVARKALMFLLLQFQMVAASLIQHEMVTCDVLLWLFKLLKYQLGGELPIRNNSFGFLVKN